VIGLIAVLIALFLYARRNRDQLIRCCSEGGWLCYFCHSSAKAIRHRRFRRKFLPAFFPKLRLPGRERSGPFFTSDCENEMRRPLRLIGIILDDTLPTLTREPVPNLRHLFQLLFQLEVYRLRRLLTALSGILLVFGDLLHGPNRPHS